MIKSLEWILYSWYFWFTLATSSIYLLYLKFVKFTYWKRQGIPYEEPVLIAGNLLRSCFHRISLGEDVRRNYEKLCEHPIHGIYMLSNPILLVNDPELIRTILVKEFHRFRDRGLYFDDKVDPLTSNLFFLPGEKWKRLRSKLTPTFTTGKLKQIYPLLKEISDGLASTVDKALETSDIIETKDLAARFTTDTISSIAFGFNCDSLNVPNSEFRKYGGMIVKERPNIMLAFGMFSPSILTTLRIPLVDKVCFNFFFNVFSEMVEYRKRENIKRNDFLNLLIQLIEKGEIEDNEDEAAQNIGEKDRITLLEACAQAFVFFFAGFETSSAAIAYALYELAINPDIQERAQAEIDDVLQTSDDCSYENCVNNLKYIDMIVHESLRKYPPSPFLNRICLEDCELPGVNYKVRKGMRLMISASGIMRNPKFYPNPDKFDPERFTPENIESRSSYVYLPFGQGPRSCIGLRVGIIQTKLALASLLSKYKFSPCEKTPIPLKYSPTSIVQVPAHGIHLKVEKR